jgi:hypothetical protein
LYIIYKLNTTTIDEINLNMTIIIASIRYEYLPEEQNPPFGRIFLTEALERAED